MRKQDIILLVCSFGAMAVGVFVPFVGQPLSWLPRVGMLVMLFISFLAVDGREAWLHVTHYPFAVFLLLLLKLIIMPIVCWGFFRLILPEYALGAALLGGASTGVAAPLLAFMVRADHILVLGGVVSTCLLLPVFLPAVLAFLGTLAQVEGGIQIDLPVTAMVMNLSFMLVVPFIASQAVRRGCPSAMQYIQRWRQKLFLFISCATNLVIFSQYSRIILDSPEYVFAALGSAALVSLVLFVFASAATFWLPLTKQLAFVISCVGINGIVVLVISVDFFSAREALVCAMYSAPFFASLFLYRFLAWLRHRVFRYGRARARRRRQ